VHNGHIETETDTETEKDKVEPYLFNGTAVARNKLTHIHFTDLFPGLPG